MIVVKRLNSNTFEATDVFAGVRATATTAKEAYALIKNTQAVREFAQLRLRRIRQLSTVQYDPQVRAYVGTCEKAGIRVQGMTRSHAWDLILEDFIKKSNETQEKLAAAQTADLDETFTTPTEENLIDG